MPVLDHVGHLPHHHHWIGVAVAIGVALFAAAVGVVLALSGRKDTDD
ncbi:MAG: hypothetical protein WDM86_02460 [Rhizomicrobium sp.]